MGKLTKEDELELIHWIESFHISRPSRKLCRDFSDAVPLAEILKSIFPKWVELHNYPAASSVALKLDNWKTMNRKVLRKIGVTLDAATMQNLSAAEGDVIEEVLFEIMRKCQSTLEAKSSKSSVNFSSDILTVSVEQEGETVQQEMILYSMYRELENVMAERNQSILILSQKNEHLDNLLKLKEQRIEDLEEQIRKLNEAPTDWLSLD